jgi:hypothetical protein
LPTAAAPVTWTGAEVVGLDPIGALEVLATGAGTKVLPGAVVAGVEIGTVVSEMIGRVKVVGVETE